MWNKQLFGISGDYLHYDGQFVARFKYSKDHGSFIKFLTRNFTVEEYFARMKSESPLEILMSKGYVPSHVQRFLTRMGFTPDTKGMDEYLQKKVYSNLHNIVTS